jgi:hypothetical protein
LRRAPDIRQACAEAYGPAETASVTSLRALLGVIGALERRTKGIEIPEAGGRIHPHFGVFAPIRREYVDLRDCWCSAETMYRHGIRERLTKPTRCI